MSFGDRLRELLELHNISQKQLGDKLNIAPSKIGNYIRNIREPDHFTLIIFANYFDVSVDFLLGNIHSKKLIGDEELLVAVYKKLDTEYKKILFEESKLLFDIQKNKNT